MFTRVFVHTYKGTYVLRARGGVTDYRISWAHSSAAAVAGGDLYADTLYYYSDSHTIYVLVTYMRIGRYYYIIYYKSDGSAFMYIIVACAAYIGMYVYI